MRKECFSHFYNPVVERLCGQCHHHSAVVRAVPDPVAGALGSTQGAVEWVLGSPGPTLGSRLPGSVCPSRRKGQESRRAPEDHNFSGLHLLSRFWILVLGWAGRPAGLGPARRRLCHGKQSTRGPPFSWSFASSASPPGVSRLLCCAQVLIWRLVSVLQSLFLPL